MSRTNAGFDIIVAVPLNSSTEVTIGYKQTSLGDQYVCWFCNEGNDYYWGNYSHTYMDALKHLVKRIEDYLK